MNKPIPILWISVAILILNLYRYSLLANISFLTEQFAYKIIQCRLTCHGELDSSVCMKTSVVLMDKPFKTVKAWPSSCYT